MDIVFQKVAFGSAIHRKAFRLRKIILRDPLGLDWTRADLESDRISVHICAIQGREVLGTMVLTPMDSLNVKMRQVCVRRDLQGCGIGGKMIAFAENESRSMGFTAIHAHIRSTSVGFYKKAGYEIDGKPFIEVTLPHYKACKQL